MNTWIFSKKGQVTEPLALAEAKKYVVENQDAYGWQSSYTQWLPVHSINEFQALLPVPETSATIPQKIVDEFVSKEQALNQYLDNVNQKLADGEANALLFAEEIENYKNLTATLSPEMKGNINEVEQQYLALKAQLSNLKQVVSLSQTKFSSIANELNAKLSSKSVKNPPVPQQAKNTKNNAPVIQLIPTEAVKTEDDIKVEQKAESAKKPELKPASRAETENNSTVEVIAEQKNDNEVQANPKDNNAEELEAKKVPTAKVISTRAPKRVDVKKVNTGSDVKKVDTQSNQSSSDQATNTATQNNADAGKQANEKAKLSAVKESAVEAKAESNEKATSTGNLSSVVVEDKDGKTGNLQTKLESGVKNIFKSVFTKEEAVVSKSIFTDLIEKDGQNDDAKSSVTEIVSSEKVNSEDSSEDEALKAPRRRRRR